MPKSLGLVKWAGRQGVEGEMVGERVEEGEGSGRASTDRSLTPQSASQQVAHSLKEGTDRDLSWDHKQECPQSCRFPTLIATIAMQRDSF